MALTDLTYFRQLEDYTLALTTYIKAATGLPDSRIIFSAPDVAKRKLKERNAVLAGDAQPASGGKTVEVDQFVSFYFPFGSPGLAEYRQSPQQSFWGGSANASGVRGFVDHVDLAVQIDVWGGPDQKAKDFVFSTRMAIEAYMFRHQRIQVAFRDLVTKDPVRAKDPSYVWDVNCWYEVNKGEAHDNSLVEALFEKGSMYRGTIDFTWFTSFYRVNAGDPNEAFKKIARIIYMSRTSINDEFETEWIITTTTSSSSSSSSSSTSTTTL